MKKYGVFMGKDKESSVCIKIFNDFRDFINTDNRENFDEVARMEGTNVYFYLCSEKQEIGSAYLK